MKVYVLIKGMGDETDYFTVKGVFRSLAEAGEAEEQLWKETWKGNFTDEWPGMEKAMNKEDITDYIWTEISAFTME